MKRVECRRLLGYMLYVWLYTTRHHLIPFVVACGNGEGH